MTAEARKPPRRRLPAAEARERILDAAQRRLADEGPDAIRLKDLAADLGISHPAILHHFGSRDGLMEALEHRAMRALEADLLEADGSTRDALERVARTLGDEGHARLIAWWAMGNGVAPSLDWHMLRTVADSVHENRRSDALRQDEPPPSAEDTDFVVRLVAAAMLGEALLGPILTQSLGLEDDEDVSRRFRAWLAEWLQR